MLLPKQNKKTLKSDKNHDKLILKLTFAIKQWSTGDTKDTLRNQRIPPRVEEGKKERVIMKIQIL